VVVGSSNTDLTVMVEDLPEPGETVLGGDLLRAAGGKGANQAVAAARAGAEVSFVGRVGDDEFGRATLENLRRERVDVQCVRLDPEAASGVALIMVDGNGQNLIAVAPGANGRVSAGDVAAARDLISEAQLVLLQLEIPLAAVEAAAETAHAAGARLLLDPAPAPATGALEGLLAKVDYLTPNRVEAAQLLGGRPGTPPEELARGLVQAGVGTAFLTMGPEGTLICDGGRCERIPAPQMRARDTVGAGDCFAGTLAVALAEGMPALEAARFATCASALSVLEAGAQPSLPGRDAIVKLYEHRS
jgi:ribokinase